MASVPEPQGHNEKVPVVTKRDDIGLQFIAEHGTTSYTPSEERQVRWKLDLNLMPLMMFTYGLQYLDKVAISYAAVYNMRNDLHLVKQEYSWANSMFYFGYLVGQVPANYLLQKFPTGKFVATNLLIWGVLVMLCSESHNFGGIAALRFLMGFFESGITPAWTHVTSMFYTRNEQGARCTAWFSMNGFAAIGGGLLSYGIGHTHTRVAQWQLVFLVCGAITVFWAFVVFFFFPDSPANAKFFDEKQRIIAIERLRNNRTGVKNPTFKPAQALEALRDPQVWAFVISQGVSSIGNVGGSFLPIIIQEMGFTGLQTTLLTIPAGGIEVVAMVVAGFASSFIGNGKGRTFTMFIVSIPTLLGCIFLAAVSREHTWVRIVGAWLLLTAPAATALMLSLIGSNVAGFSKKVTTTALTFVSYCIGNIVSPQLFISTEAPGYRTAMRGILTSTSIVMLIELLLAVYYILENRRRDRVLANTPQEVIDAVTFENEEYADRTDREDFLKFRYSW